MKTKTCIFIALIIFMGITALSGNVFAFYLPEELNKDLINQAIELGKQYKTDSTLERLITQEKYRFTGSFNNGIDIYTPFYRIAEESQKVSKKYKTIDETMLQSILKKETFTINTFIFSKEKSDVAKDDLYLVLGVPKIKDNVVVLDQNGKPVIEIVHPAKTIFAEESYREGIYLGIAGYEFRLKDLPKINGKVNYEITVISISGKGEDRISVDLSKLR